MDRLSLKHIDYVEATLSHPSVIGTIKDSDDMDILLSVVNYLKSPYCYVLSPREGTLFMLKKFNSCTYEVHIAITDEGDNRRWGLYDSTKVADYVFKEIPNLNKLVAFIPSDNRLCYSFAKRWGWKEEGLLKSSFLREEGGELIDTYILGITKKEFKEKKSCHL